MERIIAGCLFLIATQFAVTADFLNNGVTAHRGNSGDHPENTLRAVRSGIAAGADWVEIDIFRTRDGRLIVIHDRTTGRTGDQDLDVTQTDYADLLKVDVATEFRRRRKLSLSECPRDTIPLLEDVIKVIRQQQRTRLSIQPKMACVAEAIALIKRLQAEAWVGFNDGNLEHMSEVKRLAPEIPVFWDRGDPELAADIKIAHERGFEALVLNSRTLTREKVAAIRRANLQAGVWTVNSEPDLRRFLALGVDRIYTDHPARLLRLKAAASSPAAPRPLVRRLRNSSPQKILFVGNSYLYYNDSLHNHVRRLTEGLRPQLTDKLAYKSATIGGSTLSHHNLDSHLEPGRLGVAGPFDLVVLQGGSSDALSPAGRESFATHAAEFDRKIRATGAETALYMIHAYVKPHQRFDPDMIRKIEDLYVSTGNRLPALVIPVGLAFEEAYRQRPDLQLHKDFDGTHPSLLGTYLAACVVYGSIYGTSPVGSSYDYYGTIDRKDTLFLQNVAEQTVRRFFKR